MSFDIGQSFGQGIERIASRVGGILVGAFFVVQLVSTSAMKTTLEATAAGSQPSFQTVPGVALPIGTVGGLVLFLVAWLVTFALYVVVTRVAVAGNTDAIPEEFYSHRMGGAILHLFVAYILVGILVAIGTVFLIVPGIFLGVSFAFVLFYVAVEDDGAIEAMKHSWNLTSGNRLRVFLLVLAIGVLSVISSTVTTLILGTGILGWLVSGIVTAVVYVYALFVMGDAFVQLRDGEGDDGVDGEPAAAPA